MDKSAIKMFQDICDELGIKCTLLSKDWIFMLEKSGITRFFAGYKSSLNDHALGKVIDDKYALYDVLKTKGLPVVEYNIVYSEKNQEEYAVGCNTFDYVQNYFYEHHQDIVLKPNSGTCGVNVYRIQTISQLDSIYHQLMNRYHSINMSPFYAAKHEYRFIVLDGVVKHSFQKNKPVVQGDGIHSIRELLIAFNDDFENQLQDSKYDRILNNGEVFEYNWKFNLSQGSTSSEIEDTLLYQRLEEIALRAANAIGLRFGSVDIIETEDGEYLILEMNSGVMLYPKTRELYKEALQKLFE